MGKNYVMMQYFCKKYDWFYVDKRNIQREHLCKDGLQVIEENRISLARNEIFCLNKNTPTYFLNCRQAYTHHLLVKI